MTKPLNKAEAIREFRETGLSKDRWPYFLTNLVLSNWITWDQYIHWSR